VKRKYIIGALLGILVLGVAVLAVGFWLARPPKPDITRDVFGSAQALLTFRAAQSVSAQRLHYRRDNPQNPWKLENYVQDAPVAVAPEQARELQRLLVQESSYGWGYVKACAPNYGVLLTFRAEQTAVRVALCFECNTLGIYDTPHEIAKDINREEDFDPARRPLVAIAKAVFPTDSVIQALK
jgi:hypothetical protein